MVIRLPKQGSTGPHYTQTRRKKITVKPEDLSQHRLRSLGSALPRRVPGISCLLCVGAFVHQIKITGRFMENGRPRAPTPKDAVESNFAK